MKTKLLLFACLLITGIVMAGCNQKKQYRPDAKIVNAFNAKYPKADKVEWEQKHGYYVAEFHDNGIECEAWFDNNGKWDMTESNIRYNQLPQAIRTDFEKSMYSNWKKDNVDKIERVDMKPVYIIEVEKEGQDKDLYYSENGMLVKTVNDVKKDNLKNYMPVTADIRTAVKQKYPDATIIETDMDNGKYEVDILDNGKSKEVIFNHNKWEATKWNVTKAEVPSVVMDAYRKSDYGKYRIDEIHFFETPSNSYYHFELEQGDTDAYLSIDPQGNVIK